MDTVEALGYEIFSVSVHKKELLLISLNLALA